MGNFYKRYIYKNGVKHGPYYYSNKKVNGKVISTYLGTSPPTSKEFAKPSKFNSRLLLIILLSTISITLIVYLSINLELFSTGQPIRVPEATGIITSSPGEEVNDSNLTIDVQKPDSGGVNQDNVTEEVPQGIINDSNLTVDIPPETDAQIPEEEIESEIITEQQQAVINLPVEWRKEITLPKEGPVKVEIPAQASEIKVYSIDESGNKEEVSETNIGVTAQASAEIVLEKKESAIISFFRKIFNFLTGRAVTIEEKQDMKEVIINENKDKYEVIYETPGPSVTEEETNNSKKVTVNSPSGLNYQDVLVYTNIEFLGISDAESVGIYSINQDEYVAYTNIGDTNEDGILDYLEWLSPTADNQAFEIIVITRAEHLDENRTFVSDIYEEVKSLDDLFSEEIPDHHYVRVTFEQNLTSEKDITIFPKIARGNPKIEVYEKDKDILIAEFSDIVDNEYNTIYLTNLQNRQDTFDLKIVGGSVFFDHIVDPVLEGDGRIVYGEGTVSAPRTRVWVNSTQSWENPESSLNAAAATIRHVVVKSSPTRDEMLVGIQSTNGNLYIQRWNGSIWASEWNVAVGDGNLPRFDIVYEQNSGEALVVYGTNTATNNEIAYRVWNGNSWIGPTNYNAVRTSGIIQGLAMVSLTGSNDVAIVWGDSNLDLSANYWNGASNVLGLEPGVALSTGVDTLSAATSLTTWSFDLEFESLSGELLIAWGNAAETDITYVTRGAGAGGTWGSVSFATAFGEQSDDLEMSADPNSNQILLVHTGANSGADIEAAIWTGISFPSTIDTGIPCAANVICGIDGNVDTTGIGTSGNAGGWLTDSGNTRAIVTYDDRNAAGIGWAVWNPTAGWTLQPDCNAACNSQPTGGSNGDDKLHRIRMNPLNNAELMFIGVDRASDLYAKKLVLSGTTLTWSSTEPSGIALETLMSSITGFAADFAYNKFIPVDTPPAISNPNTNTSSINLNEYFCLNATVTDASGISVVYAEVWNTTSWLNYTMTETGGSCSGTGSDGVYGVSIQGTSIGLWNYSKVYANDTFNNKNVLDFSDLTINVTTIPNSPPTIPYVEQPLSAIPNELGIRNVVFNVRVSDSNGVADIDNLSVKANFTKSGEPSRFGSCSWINDVDANTANYSCSITMQYYDASLEWNIGINATDLIGSLAVNNSALFTYGELKAIILYQPSSLSWSTLLTGQTNIPANNDPTIVNNTGNVDGNIIFMTGHNLTGELNPTEKIPSYLFRAGGVSGSECSLSVPLNDSLIQWISNVNLPRGPGAVANIYYCLSSVPFVSSQNYSAKGSNAWIIQI